MLDARTKNIAFDLSFFDLFFHGLTNLARHLYFGMDLATIVAEQRFVERDQPPALGIGPTEYDFVERYIRFLVSQNLVHANYSDLRVDLDKNEMIPVFLVPLSRRGRSLRNIVSALDKLLIAEGVLAHDGISSTQESFVEISERQLISKFPRIAQIGRVIRQSRAKPDR